MARKWQSDRKKDQYYREAKKRDYRSRAYFKLIQLTKKFNLIKRGGVVLDLGAAPGGWTEASRELVGPKGKIVSLDLEEIQPFKEDNIHIIKGDMTKAKTLNNIKAIQPRFDIVISDASPDISGVWDIDHFNSIELTRKALKIALETLKEGGNFLVKVFQGELVKEFTEEINREFEFTKTAKPKASRSQSSEVYIIGKGRLKTPVKHGDIIEADILYKSEQGDGVAEIEGFRIFVENSQPGDSIMIKIKKVTRRYAEAIKI